MEKEFLSRKYNHYNPSPFDGDCVVDCYQKSFCDEDGKRKYFLTWKKWDFGRFRSAYPDHPDLSQPKYEACTQLTHKNGNVINIDFLNGWQPEEAEDFLNKLFETGWFNKYDD